MKYVIIICFIFCAGFFSGADGAECTRYLDDAYRYSVCASDKWKKSFRELDAKNVFVLTRSDGAKITVSASRYEGESRTRWENWRRWYVKKEGAGIRKIIESKEVPAGENVSIKLLLFDYSTRAGRVLQRTMLMKYGDNMLSVDCRAPLKTFARYTDQFNELMSSVDVSGTLPEESMQLMKNLVTGRERRPSAVKPEPIVKPEPLPEPEPVVKPEPIVEPEPAVIPEQIPEAAEPAKPRSYPELNITGENRPDTKLKRMEEAGLEDDVRKGEAPVPQAEIVTDPATKKAIDDELKKIQELEQKGIIEKVDGK